MRDLRQAIFRAGLETLHWSGGHRLLGPFCGGAGVVLTMHHVRPQRPDAFQPNSILEITPEFLRTILETLREMRFDIVTMDEAVRRLHLGDDSRRFAVLTFDDGYRDNRDHALPVLREMQAPCLVYVASRFADQTGRMWWLALEEVIAATDNLTVAIQGRARRFECATAAQKDETFDAIYWAIRGLPSPEIDRIVDQLVTRHLGDYPPIARRLCMNWDELADVARDPLVSIGAHSVSHDFLSRCSEESALAEMSRNRTDIRDHLGLDARHFAFPYGDATAAGPREFALAKAAGFETAVTTRPGMLYPEHAGHLTALPRLSVNGKYQDSRFLRVMLSGAPTALWNGFRHVNAA